MDLTATALRVVPRSVAVIPEVYAARRVYR
jgi:hypothetical protein